MKDTEMNEYQLGQFIPLHYHFQMLQDEARMRGFKEAIMLTVPEGGRAVDLGGGTGVLSFFAAQRASKVWCVERQPAMVLKARELLAQNVHEGKVEVVQADAFDYLPPEPVDAVICEMLHSALLREKQVDVLASFTERYAARFGKPLPVFLPEATILGFELINHDFDFYGYNAAVPVFQGPGNSERIRLLSAPVPYAIVQYRGKSENNYIFNGDVPLGAEGLANALRFITNNIIATVAVDGRTINWMNQNLILPLPEPLPVRAGDTVRVRFSYRAGDEIEVLQKSIGVNKRNEEAGD